MNAAPLLVSAGGAPSIVVATLNAKYIHASLGLRYLLANMGELRAQTVMREFTIASRAQDVVDALLLTGAGAVQIVGFGVYIWNVRQTAAVLRLLKAARPALTVVLGGPEVSHELDAPEIVEIVKLADHVVTGWGDVSFPRLCRALLHGAAAQPKVIAGEQPPLAQIALPYAEYSDADLAHRLLYVEASRGCPFKCHFCLSALDKTAWAFDLDLFLAQLQTLHRRGARNFKFVDRTFNLKIDSALAILQFFLDRLPGPGESLFAPLFVHFEVIPDHLPDRLKQMIARFPPGVLQFEVGVQSFNVEVQQRIARRQDNVKTQANLQWLLGESNAHLHADLIFGLPGETLESFARGFDRLYAIGPHEIQLGVLKRLRGTPIAQHSDEFAMVYDADPPYAIRQTSVLDAATVTRFMRLARYWELIANSGRFKATLRRLLNGVGEGGEGGEGLERADSGPVRESVSPFYAFLAFSDWLWERSGKTNGFTPELLVDLLWEYLVGVRGERRSLVEQSLLDDYRASGARGSPASLKALLTGRDAPHGRNRAPSLRQSRQSRHLAGGSADG